MRKLVIVLVLAACQKAAPLEVQKIAPSQGSIPEGIAIAAEHVAVRAVVSGFGDVDAVRVASCVRGHANDAELLILADGALHSTTSDELALVTSIINRSTTQQCLLENGQIINT